MTGNLEYDGVVGITQCPISPTDTFTYEWQVDETPGRLWFFFSIVPYIIPIKLV